MSTDAEPRYPIFNPKLLEPIGVPRWLACRTEVSAAAKLVHSLVSRSRYAVVTLDSKQLMTELGLSDQEVRIALQELHDVALIVLNHEYLSVEGVVQCENRINSWHPLYQSPGK